MTRRERPGQRRSPARGRKALAVSFVVTIASVEGTTGCKKQSGSSDGPRVRRWDSDGLCYLEQPTRCPPGATCNPPPPLEVDCPPELRDAGDPPRPTRRPPGKEDWLRVTPTMTFVSEQHGCLYTPAWFCSPPSAKKAECTKRPAPAKVACSLDADAGVRRFEPFVYEDALGECRKVPASECAPTPNGRCEVPEGDVVPCPSAAR